MSSSTKQSQLPIASSIPTRVHTEPNLRGHKKDPLKTTHCNSTNPKSKHVLAGKTTLRAKSERELLSEENTKLQTEISEQKKKFDRLKDRLHNTQKTLNENKKQSEDKENKFTDQISTLEEQNSELDHRLTSYEQKMLMCNINPVSLEVLETTDGQTENIQKKRELAKNTVLNLKQRITQMNEESLKLLNDMKDIGEEIDKIGTDNSLKSQQKRLSEGSAGCTYDLF